MGKTIDTRSVSFTMNDMDIVQYVNDEIAAGNKFSVLVKAALREYMKKDSLTDQMKKEIIDFIKDNVVIANNVQVSNEPESNIYDGDDFMKKILNMK